MFISKYEVSRHYGGPEEGGWWYDRHVLVHTIASGLTEDAAFTRVRSMNEKAREERDHGGMGRFSVLGGEDVVFYAEDVVGEMDDSDEPRPYYC